MAIKTLDPQLKRYLDEAILRGASDLHLVVNWPATLRIDSELSPIPKEQPLPSEQVRSLLESILVEEQLKHFSINKDVDFSFGYGDYRFRVNLYVTKGDWSASFRLIPNKIRTFSELGLPPILEKFSAATQGFFIITGPTGHGKSTVLAAMVDYINRTRTSHIITIEDPIEYVFTNNKSIISQREIGSDVPTFARGLRAALREDPNVVLVGEMRDLETIDAALTLAETGHLVLATLHTNSAAQTADRIIDVFPPYQQQQVRQQFAGVLLGIVSQRLVNKASGGRIHASEIMVATPAVRSLIREGKTHQLSNVIATSASDGMIAIDKVLAELVSKGEITIEEALKWAIDPKQLKTMVY